MKVPIKTRVYHDERDVAAMQALIQDLGREAMVVDLAESMLLPSVQAATRLWFAGETLVAFAFVDDYHNLRFEIRDEAIAPALQAAIVAWGMDIVGARDAGTGRIKTLDAAVPAANRWQIDMLASHGFARVDFRSLRYARALTGPIEPAPLPAGYSIRPVTGEEEVEALVALHRAAFGTANMTAPARLAMMRVPGYEPALDLVVVTPAGSLAAFCVCGLDEADSAIGYTDPIGTQPAYQRQGFASAVVTAGLGALQARGVTRAELGTGSQNLPMQRLAARLDFQLVGEKLWFSKSLQA